MSYRLGVDIGGTFTDFALLEQATGRLVIHKQLTTPADPSVAVLAGVPVVLSRAGVTIGDVDTVVHGTTLVTNALIERRGAVTGMVCTAGFADVLDIAMERRYDMYDLRIAYPAPLVPRPLRAEVDERIGADGTIQRPLDAAAVVAAVRAMVDGAGIEALAVCLLNAYANAAHEQAIRAVVNDAFPALYVSTSADVFPFMREYERWTTTTMSAFTQPIFDCYLGRLEDGLAAAGFTGALYIMTSSGGTVTAAAARRYPVRALASGPAAGVLVSARTGNRLGRGELLAYDMGGTTAKGALLRGGTPMKRYEMEVARVHDFKAGSGLPAKVPVIDLIEIGAGGGSIAAVDARGTIGVGPRSAGADPGPVCYGRGGSEATLTDANLLLGYLDPAFFLGGDMALDRAGAAAVAHRTIAAPLGVADARAAWGIHETVNEDVARAFRNHASERGFDYRTAAMVAFGGCGPIHALRVAAKLRVPTVIFPPGAGVMSAVGLLVSPLAFEMLKSERIALADLTPAGLDAAFRPLVAEALAQLAPAGVTAAVATVHRALDMRYRGQGYDIEVALPDGPADAVVRALPALFARAYEAVFAKSFPAEALDILSWKVTVAGPEPMAGVTHRLDAVAGQGAAGSAAALKGRRRAYFPEPAGFIDCDVYDRYALAPGDAFAGPALVEERESTCVVGVGDRAHVDDDGNLIVAAALQGRGA